VNPQSTETGGSPATSLQQAITGADSLCRRRFLRLAACAVMLVTVSAPAGDKIVWKAVDDAQLKLDGRGVDKWKLYVGEKKKNLLVVQLGRRMLALDKKAHEVYELPPNVLQAHGKVYESENPASIGRRIPSSEWEERDIGPAELLRVKLGDYGSKLELQIPHLVDLRSVY
jgi:hypothetical protein